MRLLFLKLFVLFFFSLRSQNFEIKLLSEIHRDSSVFKDKLCLFTSRTVAPFGISFCIGLTAGSYINNDKSMLRNGFRSSVSSCLANASSFALKNLVQRARPFNKYPSLFRNKSEAGNLSFPSGHTTAAFSTATALALTYRKWEIVLPAYLWASGVAFSRMYLGVHYPSDVMGGILIGVGSGLLTWKLDQLLFEKK